MKKISLMLRKCKSLSRQLGRSYSYTSLRSQSTREDNLRCCHEDSGDRGGDRSCVGTTVFVGSTRKRYVVSPKHLKHPLLDALVDRSDNTVQMKNKNNGNDGIVIKCEVVLFDHLLWMLENGDQSHILESLEELADLYVV